MSSFFRKETKNRILVGLTASAVLASSLIGMTTKAFAEDTAPAMTVTVASAPANPANTEKWNYVFDTNGGSFADGSTTKTVTLDSYSASVNAPATPSKPGMTFVGWADIPNSDARGTKGVYTVDASNAYETGNTDENGNVTHTRTLYAVYKLNIDITGTTEAPVYRFDANGGHAVDGTDTVVEAPATSGMTDDNVPAPTVVRDGYTFVGWGRRPDSNGMSNLGTTNVNFLPAISDEIPMTNDTGRVYHTVYAIWKQNVPATQHKNTYVFDANGGSIVGATNSTSTLTNANPAYVANVSAPKAEKPGYDFVGWAKDQGASASFVLGNNTVDFSGVNFTTENDSDGNTVNVYKVYAVYKIAAPHVPITPNQDTPEPAIPGNGEQVPTDGVPPILEPVAGKNTVMFYSGKLNKGETSITNTGEHADVVAPNSEYSLIDGTIVKRWVSTDGSIVLMPGGHYDADSIKDKVFVADYVTNSPHDYDPNQEYPQNVSQIQLIFHGNGGVDEHGAIQYATSGDPSATDLPVRPTYTREGYTFKGWSRNGYGTEVNVITTNNMINLKSIGKRSVMADPNDPHKFIVVYNVYAIWEKDEVTPDNPDTPPAPDTPDTPGETPDTVTPDNPVTPGNQNSTSSTNETPSQSTDTEKTSKKKTDNPETGDAASSAGIIAGIGAIFTSLGIMRKRRNQ